MKKPGILLTIGGILGIIFWVIMLLYALLLGGSPGPGYERTVPMGYAAIIALGLAGAIVELAARRKSSVGMVITAAVLGAAGSVPFFLLGLTAMGIIALAVGIVFPCAYLPVSRR
jgi:hypothetical protein